MPADPRTENELLQRTALSATGGYDEEPEQAPPGPGQSPGGAVFLCLVQKDGGDPGGEAQECTWTYKVKDLAGNTLKKDDADNDAEEMTPLIPRLHYCEYWHADADREGGLGRTTVYALAAYDGLDLVLIQCFGEIAKRDDC